MQPDGELSEQPIITAKCASSGFIIILSCYLFYLIAYFAETSKLSKLDVFLPTGNTIFVVGKGN